jgi:predicted ATPase/class 3 adenylate cyclase
VAELPSGTVTFLLTDVEGSAALWERDPEAMRRALARHDALLGTGVARHGGVLVKSRGEGDSVFAVFDRAQDAVVAACEIQRAFRAEPWPTAIPLCVRMALHTGAAELREGDYYGSEVNRCARLRGIGHGGQALLSEATAALARDSLPEGSSLLDLGQHRLRDLARPERVFQLLHPDLPAGFPPLRSLDASLHNLPLQLTRFIGRERELAAVEQVLASERLITLVGPGGAGKTRLALQVAADQVERIADGVWLVELAALADPALVPQTVVSVLGVREEPGRPLLAALLAALGTKRLLLVLDNCEHLIQACAELAAGVLRACPGVRILATSREALAVAGEAVWTVPPLSLPDTGQPPSPEGLTRYEAVRLFVDRASLGLPSFALTPQNAPAVARICQRLDGIPLAIEMAAARVRALSVEQVARRLDDRFRLLTGGSRAALPRQQTLRALVDWGYDLLSDQERSLFGRLSVFAGGWSLEAAEAVCAGDGIESDDVLDLLGRLVDKSLVVAEPGAAGAVRYRLLEILGQYGRERLAAQGEAEATGGRHAAFFLDLAERAEPELYGPRQATWHRELDREHDNLRTALRWFLERGRLEALRLARALWWFWHQRQLWTEGRDWLERALALPGASDPTVTRAWALQGAGLMAAFQRDLALARRRLEEAVEIAREVGNGRALGRALGLLGVVSAFDGDQAAAQALFQQSLGIARRGDDLWSQSMTLRLLATGALGRGDRAEADALLEESLSTARASGDLWCVAMTLNTRGDLARAQGDYRRAGALYEESVLLFRQHGVGGMFGGVLHNLGYVALQGGDEEHARALFEEALGLFRRMGDRRGMAECLAGLAGVLGAWGQAEPAARLFGAAEAAFEALGTSPSPHNQADYDRNLAAVRAALADDAFTAARTAGRGMTTEQAIAYAMWEPGAAAGDGTSRQKEA